MGAKRPLRVLYAEDDPGAGRLLQRRLQRLGHEVALAQDGRECLQMLERSPYDVLLLDHDMPRISGLDVIRNLAQQGELPPTVVVTGAGNETIAVEAIKLGAEDYIMKDSQASYLELIPSAIEQALAREELREQHRRATHALKKSEALLAEAGKLARVGGWELDVSSNTLTWTTETHRIHEVPPGYEPDLSSALDFYVPEDRPILEEALERAVKFGEGYDLELRLITARGNIRWTRSIARVDRDDEGVVRVTGVFQDITDMKEAQKQALFQAQLLENVRESVVATDLEGTIIYWGKGAQDLYGYSCDEAMGRNITFIVESGKAHEEEQRMRRTREEGFWAGEYRQQRKDGAYFWADTRISLVNDEHGMPMGFVGIDRDISERKRWAEELSRRLHEISAINQLCRDITESLSVGKVVDKTRSRLFEALSVDDVVVHLLEGDRLIASPGEDTERTLIRDADGETPLGECLCGLVARDRHPVYCKDIYTDERCTLTECKSAGITSFAAVPLLLGDQLVGVLGVASLTERDFMQDSAFLEAIAGQLATGLQNARLYEEEQQRSTELKAARMALQEANDMLEQRVEERTQALVKVNEDLKLAQTQWERTFDAVPDLIAILDSQQRIQRVNKALADRLGVSPQEAVDRPCYELFHGTDGPPDFCPHPALVHEGEEQQLEVAETYLDGTFFVTISPFYDQEGTRVGSVHIARDITARKEMEEALRDRERFLSDVFSGIQDGICVLDPDLNIVRVNHAFESARESLTPLLGKKCYEVRSRRSEPCPSCPATRTLETGLVQEEVQYRPEGEGESAGWVHVNTFPLIDSESGSVKGVIEYLRDITAQKQAEEGLKESEKRYRTLVESMNEGLVVLDRDFHVKYVNDSMCAMLGFTRGEMLGRPAMEFIPEEALAQFRQDHIRRLEGDARSHESILQRKDGTLAHVLISPNVTYDKDANATDTFAVMSDVTALKEAQARIQASLKEKEVLLREIHHRVKNNLAVVSSLLILQSKHASEPATRDMFAEAGTRVRSMAMVHEKIYASADLAQIDMREYVDALINYLHALHAGLGSRLRVFKDVDPIFFNPDTAMPVGFLITELFINSMKHAFAPGEAGEVHIRLRRRDDEELELVVRDNGRGIPPEVDLDNPRSLGLELVSTFALQLDGTLGIETTEGTEVSVRFREIRKHPPRRSVS